MFWVAFGISFFVSTQVWCAPTLEAYYPNASPVEIVRESGVRILIADTDAFRQSAPENRSLSNQRILRAIKKAVSHIRKTQLQGVGSVSTQIQTSSSDPAVEAYVVSSYGRAFVAKIKPDGEIPLILLDVKGNGADEPVQMRHSNGLLSLPVAMKEFVVSHLVQKIFEHAGIDYGVVPHIAVAASDFFILREDGSKVLAGKIVRGPHRRMIRNNQTHFFVDHNLSIQIERTLNLFGLSSLAKEDDSTFLNIQGTPTKEQIAKVSNSSDLAISLEQLFDFGHYSLSDQVIDFPPDTVAFFNALPGNSFGTVHHSFTSYFPRQFPRIGLIHNLLSGSGADKIIENIYEITNTHCPAPENCDKEKLFETLSQWAERFLHQVEDQLKTKSFAQSVVEKLGPFEGFKILSSIYNGLKLTPKGRAELWAILQDPRFNADEAPHMEILRQHPDLAQELKEIQAPKVPSSRTNFIRNISAKYRPSKEVAVPEVIPGEVDIAPPLTLPSEPAVTIPEPAPPKGNICSRLVTKIRKFLWD